MVKLPSALGRDAFGDEGAVHAVLPVNPIVPAA
jgi:hypothetical protein